MGKIMKSLAIGTMFGVGIGVMIAPELDRKTQKAIRKNSRKLIDSAGEVYENISKHLK